MNDEWRIWRGFLENPIIFFSHSPFSPIHLFFNFPKLLNSYFLSFPSRSALIRVYLRQKNPFLFSIFSFPQLSSSFLFQTAKLLQNNNEEAADFGFAYKGIKRVESERNLGGGGGQFQQWAGPLEKRNY